MWFGFCPWFPNPASSCTSLEAHPDFVAAIAMDCKEGPFQGARISNHLPLQTLQAKLSRCKQEADMPLANCSRSESARGDISSLSIWGGSKCFFLFHLAIEPLCKADCTLEQGQGLFPKNAHRSGSWSQASIWQNNQITNLQSHGLAKVTI